MDKKRVTGNAGRLAAFGATALAALLWAGPSAALSSTRFCAPSLSQLPDTPAPVFDGTKPGSDPAWFGAFKYVVGDGTTDPNATVQMVQKPDHSVLYMTVEVPADAFCSGNDGILVAFDTNPTGAARDGGASHRFQRFEAFPFPLWFGDSGPPCSSAAVPPATGLKIANYYTGDASSDPSGVTWTQQSPIDGLKMGYASAIDPITGSAYWHIELQIVTSVAGGIGLPLSGDFGMYWEVISSHEPINAVSEFTWPEQCEDGSGGTTTGGCVDALATNGGPLCMGTRCVTPDKWGTVSLDTNNCKGVSISAGIASPWANAIGVSDSGAPGAALGSDIYAAGGNYFHALVTNSGATPATGITAQFRVANFGTSFGTNPWEVIAPVPKNPTDPVSIAAGVTTDLIIGPWTPQPGLYNDTSDPHGTGHQCVLVQLSSSSNATFVSASAYRNMNIHAMSAFQETAVIDTRGLGAPATGGGAHKLAYFVKRSPQYVYGDGTYPGLANGRLAAQLGWYFHPYRFTGKQVTIHGNKRELVFPGPGFGFNAVHDMDDSFQTAFRQRKSVEALWEEAACQSEIGLRIARKAALVNTKPALSVAVPKPAARAQLPTCFDPPDPHFFQKLNMLLATDTGDKPAVSEFQMRVDGMMPLAGTNGNWYTVDVPPDSVVKVAANAGYGDGGLPPQVIGLPDAGAGDAGGGDAGSGNVGRIRCTCDVAGGASGCGAGAMALLSAAFLARGWRRRTRRSRP